VQYILRWGDPPRESLTRQVPPVEWVYVTGFELHVDVTGLELSCAISDARLWGVPYADGGDELSDGILGLKIPAAAVEEVAAMRQLLLEAR
jgi:hypothetical protein